MTRAVSILPAVLLAVHCKNPSPPRADAGASRRAVPSTASAAPAASAVASAAAPSASAGAARECAREHWPEPWRPRQTTAKPAYSVECRGDGCVPIEPYVERFAACEARCRAVAILPRVGGEGARARAVRALFDAATAEFRAGDCWLTFLDYTVHHDADGVLDVSFRASGSGAYPSLQIAHVAIELATAQRIRAGAAFSARSRAELEGALRRRVLAAWRAVAKAHPEVYSRREPPAFRAEHLENFVVHADGVTFFFDFGLPHVVASATPDSEFHFTSAELRRFVDANGPLRFLAVP